MKRQISIGIIVILLLACNAEPGKKSDSGKDEKKIPVMDHPDYAPGLALVEKSDCPSCHKISEIFVGPSYVAIAGKYESTPENISLLTNKILKGGQGVWGQVPMLAHPTLSKEEAEKMVRYILLLKP